jgi:hypothetical protein
MGKIYPTFKVIHYQDFPRIWSEASVQVFSNRPKFANQQAIHGIDEDLRIDRLGKKAHSASEDLATTGFSGRNERR